MMKTLQLIMSVVLIGIITTSNGQTQSLSIEASQNITNFKFVDSQGNVDDKYAPLYSGGYALGYRYNLDMGMFFGAKLGMRKAGATYVYDAINYSWNLDYAEARIVLGYSHSFGKLGAHFVAQPYFGYLLRANQSLNNEDFDIRNSGDLSTTDFGVFLSPGANFSVSDDISVYLDLNYMLGLANLETETTQISKNKLVGATLGLAFKIK